uniref:Uncharacterized protein n=1 Tax=Aegilops tauschii subsp. strangulata TaxID=200361 RepID=A0A453N844_AEGTS
FLQKEGSLARTGTELEEQNNFMNIKKGKEKEVIAIRQKGRIWLRFWGLLFWACICSFRGEMEGGQDGAANMLCQIQRISARHHLSKLNLLNAIVCKIVSF